MDFFWDVRIINRMELDVIMQLVKNSIIRGWDIRQIQKKGIIGGAKSTKYYVEKE